MESDVDSIDTTNNHTSGKTADRLQRERLEKGTKEITEVSSCPGCATEQTVVIKLVNVTRDDLRGRSRFNETGAFTETKAKGGPRLQLIGTTGTRVNGTVLRRENEGEERRTRDGTSKAGCKEGEKDCNYKSTSTGVTVIRTKSDSTVEDDVVVSVKKISTASYKL